MENILYLDDYINFYVKKLDKIINIKPYKKTLYNGKIIDRKKFIKNFQKIKDEYKLNNFIFNEKITLIINSTYNKEDKIIFQEIMEELEYKNITFINELEFIKIDKKSIFINFNYSYFYLYYLNEFGNIKLKVYQNDLINKKLLIHIIELINKKQLIITGKNYKELINILKKTNYKYFYYEKNDYLFIHLLLKNKNV